MKDQEIVKQLISQIALDDSIAFAKFYDLYYSRIFKFSTYFSSGPTCREIVSDVFYNLWVNRKNLGKLENFDGYIYTAVKNQCMKHKKNQERHSYDQLEDISGDYYIETESPELLLIGGELKTMIEQAVNELPPKCKTVFMLIREEGLKYKEVAELLSVSERTVQAHMVIAVKKIVTTIRKHYPNIGSQKAFILFLLVLKKNKKKTEID